MKSKVLSKVAFGLLAILLVFSAFAIPLSYSSANELSAETIGQETYSDSLEGNVLLGDVSRNSDVVFDNGNSRIIVYIDAFVKDAWGWGKDSLTYTLRVQTAGYSVIARIEGRFYIRDGSSNFINRIPAKYYEVGTTAKKIELNAKNGNVQFLFSDLVIELYYAGNFVDTKIVHSAECFNLNTRSGDPYNYVNSEDQVSTWGPKYNI